MNRDDLATEVDCSFAYGSHSILLWFELSSTDAGLNAIENRVY